MNRAVLQACLPWLALLAALVVVAALLVRLCGSRPRPSRLFQLHADQDGGSQSLSFVLTLPVFAMFMVLILQISQLMISTVLVHYAAFATARAAIVWIPAQIGSQNGYGGESENCIGSGAISFIADDNAIPANVLPEDPSVASSGPSSGGMTYIVPTDPASCGNSYKLSQILNAAVLGCLPMSPSDSKGLTATTAAQNDLNLLVGMFSATTAGSAVDNAKVSSRFQNKLAWASNNTTIELRFYHANGCDVNGNVVYGSQFQVDPPLGVEYPGAADPYPPLIAPATQPPAVAQPYPVAEYQPNEIGWQDSITVTVHHNLALLPVGGWVLKGITGLAANGPDALIGQVVQAGGTYICPLTAKATLGLEGEKSVVPYAY